MSRLCLVCSLLFSSKELANLITAWFVENAFQMNYMNIVRLKKEALDKLNL
jgi:hypothetical protein